MASNFNPNTDHSGEGSSTSNISNQSFNSLNNFKPDIKIDPNQPELKNALLPILETSYNEFIDKFKKANIQNTSMVKHNVMTKFVFNMQHQVEKVILNRKYCFCFDFYWN